MTPPNWQTKAAARTSRASAARASSSAERAARLLVLPTAAPTAGVEKKAIAATTIVKMVDECIVDFEVEDENLVGAGSDSRK